MVSEAQGQTTHRAGGVAEEALPTGAMLTKTLVLQRTCTELPPAPAPLALMQALPLPVVLLGLVRLIWTENWPATVTAKLAAVTRSKEAPRASLPRMVSTFLVSAGEAISR